MTYEKALKIIEELEEEYEYVGIRFEDKKREIGDICENSKDNYNREDEREFPEYGTPEYDEMEELEGTCAWLAYEFKNKKGEVTGWTEHAYIIASNDYASMNFYTPDENEILIANAEVKYIIY